MKNKFIALALASAMAAQAAPFDCKPPDLLGPEVVRAATPVGYFASWRCANGVIQMVVVRRDFLTDGLRSDWDAFLRDPSHARMNSTLAKYQTGDWRTDPKLVEVWAPYVAQINALR